MRLSYRHLCLPKGGNGPEDYEDAFCPERQHPRTVQVAHPRFAVADGATESSFAGLWAQKLVRLFCNSRSLRAPTAGSGMADLQQAVEKQARAWYKEVNSQPLPWNALERVQLGAFSTLLGLALENHEDSIPQGGTWSAFAVGDSCLCQVRASQLIASFPMTDAQQFGYHPTLLSTNLESNRVVWQQPTERLIKEGTWQVGDIFLLMTDAMAHWFLNRGAHDVPGWQELGQYAKSRRAFEGWISDLRAAKTMRNDDVTLLIVELQPTRTQPSESQQLELPMLQSEHDSHQQVS